MSEINVPSAAKTVERFVVAHSVLGYHLTPVDAQACDLLRVLVEGETDPEHRPDSASAVPIKRVAWGPFEWESMADGLRRIRSSAKAKRLGVRIFGDLARRPIVQIWRLPALPAAEPMRPVFDDDGSYYRCSWGFSELYEDDQKAFDEAVRSGDPIDTGWFGAKKEIVWARVCRPRRGGRLELSVRAEMDELDEGLVDSAIWRVVGKALDAGNGFEALTAMGLTEKAAEKSIEFIVSTACDSDIETSAMRSDTASPSTKPDKVLERLVALWDLCDDELKDHYKELQTMISALLKAFRRSRGGCIGCKHYSHPIPDSRSGPAEPAECGHPRYGVLLSHNRGFPFEAGCKRLACRRAVGTGLNDKAVLQRIV